MRPSGGSGDFLGELKGVILACRSHDFVAVRNAAVKSIRFAYYRFPVAVELCLAVLIEHYEIIHSAVERIIHFRPFKPQLVGEKRLRYHIRVTRVCARPDKGRYVVVRDMVAKGVKFVVSRGETVVESAELSVRPRRKPHFFCLPADLYFAFGVAE